MKQAYLSDAVSGVPASSGATSVGNPTDGDPAGGVDATAIGAYAFYQLYKELEALIEDGGGVPDVDSLTQVRDAVRALITSAAGLTTSAADARYLRRTQNLGDVNNAGTARGNLAAAPLNSPVLTGRNPRALTPRGDRQRHEHCDDRFRSRPCRHDAVSAIRGAICVTVLQHDGSAVCTRRRRRRRRRRLDHHWTHRHWYGRWRRRGALDRNQRADVYGCRRQRRPRWSWRQPPRRPRRRRGGGTNQ